MPNLKRQNPSLLEDFFHETVNKQQRTGTVNKQQRTGFLDHHDGDKMRHM